MAADGSVMFSHLPAEWLVPAVLLAAMVAAWWAWTRYGPMPGGRVSGLTARAARAAGTALLILLAAGPAWRSEDTTVIPGVLLVAVDRSASMATADGSDGRPRLAEAARLAEALHQRVDGSHCTVAWAGVCGGPAASALDPASLAGATTTETAAALAGGGSSPIADDLARLVAERRPAAVVLVSDGRITDGGSFARLAAAWPSGTRLAVLATGGTAVQPDLAIDEVVINREAALNEREPVVVRLSHRGLPPGPVTVTVQVPDAPAQTVAVPATPAADPALMANAEARCEVVFRHEGPVRLQVSAESGGRKVSQQVTVTVRERRLTVLLLDQRPRYELRYLREAFKRDRTVTVHSYLAEGRWRRWGNDGPDHLPLSVPELAGYDVVVLGDLGPDAFRAADLANLVGAVRTAGCGLVWLPGETGSVAGFVGQPLGELLPVELPDAVALSRGYTDLPRALHRTPTAQRLGLFEPGTVDWPNLPRLLGSAPVAGVKSGADILAVDQDQRPLVVTRAYGAGRSVFLGVDDTWRWRRGVGDRYLHRFHSQLLRFAAAGHRGNRHGWRLTVDPRRAAPGEPVTLNMVPERGDLERPGEVVARLIPASGGEILVPMATAEGGEGYSARFAAPGPGVWRVEPARGPDLTQVDGDELLVLPPGGERRDPRADRPALAAFAAACGGTIHDRADDVVAHLPLDLRRIERHPLLATWWDNGWALALAVACFALDWALRRWHRLP